MNDDRLSSQVQSRCKDWLCTQGGWWYGVKVVTCICQSCYIYLSKLLHVFDRLCAQGGWWYGNCHDANLNGEWRSSHRGLQNGQIAPLSLTAHFLTSIFHLVRIISLTTVKISKNYLCSGMSNMSCRNLITGSHFFPFKRSTPKWMAFSIFKKKTEKSSRLLILATNLWSCRMVPWWCPPVLCRWDQLVHLDWL